jgi:predicted transposase YdaD
LPKHYDESLKKLVGADTQSFLDWLHPGTVLERVLPTELQSRTIFVDFLCRVSLDGVPCLVHLEFQRNIKAGMPERLLEYNVLANREHKLPVYSCVVYLMDDGIIEEAPLVRKMPNGLEILRFQFSSIRLWETKLEEFWQSGREGILPLVLLTPGNARTEVVEAVIQRLIEVGKQDLFPIVSLLASLVFKGNREYSRWLKRRFAMLRDILRETEAYQEILDEGREEGEIVTLRNVFTHLIQARFPELVALAQPQVERTTKSEVLQEAITKMLDIQTREAMLQLLLEISNA